MIVDVHPYAQFNKNCNSSKTVGPACFPNDAFKFYSLAYQENPENTINQMMKEEIFNKFSQFAKGESLHITEEKLAMYHEFAQKFKISALLEVTTPFSIFMRLTSDAVYAIWTDDPEDKEFIQKSADFLASVLPLFIQTSIFVKLRMKDLQLIFSSPNIKLNSSDWILNGLAKFANKHWTDWSWVEPILKTKLFSKESIDNFIMLTRETEMESLKYYIFQDPNKIESEKNVHWADFVNFLSPI